MLEVDHYLNVILYERSGESCNHKTRVFYGAPEAKNLGLRAPFKCP